MSNADVYDALIFTALVIQIGIQFACAFFALKAKKASHKLNGFWYYAAAAFALMGIRRITALLTFFNIHIIPKGAVISYFDKLFLPLTISILLFIGLKGIFNYVQREFEYKEALENNINKLKKLSRELKKKEL
jgi:hypothetical protein